MLLALDTATDFASIALHDGHQVLGEQSWRSQRRHTVELAPQIEAMLRLAGCTAADLQAVAVAIGPGSYTGTRVAVSLAKGIVTALDLALIGIPTLDVLAYPHTSAGFAVCALVAAGRERYCWAAYAPGPGLPQRTSDWGLHRLPDILERLHPPLRFVGELDASAQDGWPPPWDAAEVAPPALALRRAGVLAELAWLRYQSGDVDDPVALSPIYLSS